MIGTVSLDDRSANVQSGIEVRTMACSRGVTTNVARRDA
jgi:hypothetical protein